MTNFNKKKLLEIMANIAPGRGVAEHESNDENIFLKNFLPLPSHRMALEVDTLLILGERGAGKTEFFRLLANYAGRQALVKNLNIRGLPPLETTIWISGYGRTKTREKKFPAPDITENYMKYKDRIDWRIFWAGLIVGVIFQQEKELSNHSWVEEIPEETRDSLTNKLSLISHWFPDARQNFESINYALDKLDEELLASDRWLFITYDELERVVPSYLELANSIAELLAFWLDRWRRWERIRPKIFLRTDLFRQEFLGFPDASKFRGYQVSLEWETSWLYQVFVKRLANSGSEMNDYLQIVPGLISKKDEILGILPALDESCFELLMEKIVGEWMGDNAQESYTYKWIPNHLQDAKRRIVPRSFLKLFSLAAERRLKKFEEKDLPENRLLEPSDLQVALMGTSKDRIKELTVEEYPWLEALKIGLKNLNLLTEEENFLKILENTEWNQEPPSRKPQEILKYLEELGIVEIRRSDRRINMPDIYRYGFEVQRKGGIKRRMRLNNVLNINKYASAFMELDRVEEALPLFEKALQLEPDNVLTIYGYTTALMKLGRVEETLPLFEKSLQLKPDNVLTIRSYANALMKLGRVEETLPLFEKSLQLKPDNVLTIRSYANALMKLGRVEETLPLFEKSLQLKPDNVLTINSYANALMKL
ncbi:tetratricopeptide repeat protein, partial [Okeania sp. SIO3B5]|uniref:tetratricopeptide repeat protein n=1 Tax=Okeania sp. SIO3B5 TaxID=2607811 RepID=UPI00260129F1